MNKKKLEKLLGKDNFNEIVKEIEEIKQYFLDLKFLKKCVTEELNNSKGKDDLIAKEQANNFKNLYDELKGKADEKTREHLLELATPTFWLEVYKEEIGIYTYLLEELNKYKSNADLKSSKNYIKFINFVTSINEETPKETFVNINDIVKEYGLVLLTKFNDIYKTGALNYLIKKCDLSEESAMHIINTFYRIKYVEAFSKELLDLESKYSKEVMIKTWALVIIQKNITYLVETSRNFAKVLKEQKETEFKRAYHTYEDTSTYSLSAFSKALINRKETKYNLIENNINNIEVVLSGTEESKKIIKGLNTETKRVIDIIIELYRNNIKSFTDMEIAKIKYGKDIKITKDKLNAINKAIHEARSTFIEIKGQTKNKDEFYNSKNPFINLMHLGKRDKNSNTQYYQIEGVPFYYTYIVRTGGDFIPYNLEVLTRKIKGMDKREHTQNLRIYLQEKISNMKLGEEMPFISLEEIYNIDFGNGIADTRKRKYDKSWDVERILEDLQKEYKFKSHAKRKGKSIVGYRITF